jgi:hypothetical protein
MMDTKRRMFAARQLVKVLTVASLVLATASVARAAVEIIPSYGMTKSTDANAGDAQGYGGLAIRASLLPFLKAEGGIAYRQDSFSNGDVTVRQWPVTASLWASPLPALYMGGGVGWYRTTYDYSSSVPFEDATTDKIGVHLGGGLDIPIAPRLGLDLNGRYIFMQKDNSNPALPTTFNPDFWSTTLGLAIKF